MHALKTTDAQRCACSGEQSKNMEETWHEQGDLEFGDLDLAGLKTMLNERFENVDLAAAADEVRPFLRDSREIVLWSDSFFKDLADRLTESHDM